MIDERRVQKAFDLLGRANEAAEARAKHDYLENRRKALLAQIIKELMSNGTSSAEAERTAPADQRYLDHLEMLREWAEKDYRWRNHRDTASAIIDGWRTAQANLRGRDRVG